jgi:hypothetical protein
MRWDGDGTVPFTLLSARFSVRVDVRFLLRGSRFRDQRERQPVLVPFLLATVRFFR